MFNENIRHRLAAARANLHAWIFLNVHGNSIDKIRHLKIPSKALLPLIYVNPMNIRYKCNIRGAAVSNKLIRSGSWDEVRYSFEQMELKDARYISARELVENKLPVEKTVEYAQLIARLQRDGQARGLRTKAAVLSYMRSIQALYQTVIAEGRLRTQQELGRAAHGGEMNCAVGRDGTLLKTDDGNHRLAIARLLKMERVPVQISVIHADQLEIIQGIVRRGAAGNAIDAVNLYLQDIQQRYLCPETVLNEPGDRVGDKLAVREGGRMSQMTRGCSTIRDGATEHFCP